MLLDSWINFDPHGIWFIRQDEIRRPISSPPGGPLRQIESI